MRLIRTSLTVWILAAISAFGAKPTEASPLIVFRLTSSPLRKPEFFKASCDVHARYRGAFDEFWFGGGKPLCRIDVCRENLRRFEAMRPWVEKAGMRFSYQQGLTLGHDYVYVGEPGTQAAADVYASDEVVRFPDDAWMVRKDGSLAKNRMLCPRSPELLEYERSFVKAVLEEIRPASYWLDDDLRLGVVRSGCFCPRCLAAFNRKKGTTFSRETLTARLYGGDELDPLRLEWIKFNEEALANYGRVVRTAANEVMPECRLSLQTVGSYALENGRDYGPILGELSDHGRIPAGIRPGHGCYTEEKPFDLIEKALWCTREAERCRRLGDVCGTVCYEEDTYPRRVMHKSPGAIVAESALAIASGCDTVSLYWADGELDERIEDYERFVRTVARARPYFERLSASTKRTSLGGVARFIGAHAHEQKGFRLDDAGDVALARIGIPVTVAESSASNKVWRINERSRAAMSKDELERLKDAGFLDQTPLVRPCVTERKRWLDGLDRLSKGMFPVRIDLPHALRVLPRIDRRGLTDSVTLLNLSIGDTDELKIRIRQPAGTHAVWQTARKGPVPLVLERGEADNEVVVTLKNLAPWEIGTVFFQGEDS